MDICVDPFPIVNIFNLDYLFQKCLECLKNAYHDCDRLCKYIEQIIQLSTHGSLVSRVFLLVQYYRRVVYTVYNMLLEFVIYRIFKSIKYKIKHLP